MTPEKARQQERVTELMGRVVAKLAGRDSDTVWDTDPQRVNCIGVLSPAAPAEAGIARRLRAPTQPTSLGFTVELDASNSHSGQIDIAFSLYHRVYPTLDEQLEVSRVGDSVDPQGEARYRLKYRRTVIQCHAPFTVLGDHVDVSAAQLEIDQGLQRVTQSAARDQRTWRKKQRVAFPRSGLSSPERFEATFSSDEAEVPIWGARLAASVVRISGARFLSVSLENSSVEADFSRPFLFDVSISCRLEVGRYASRPFHLAASDFRYSTESWGRGVNCVLRVADDATSAHTDTAPLSWQPRLISRPDADGLCEAARLSGEDCLLVLRRVGEHLRAYLNDWEADPGPLGHEIVWATDRELYLREVERFELGVEALQADARVLRSFRLANAVAARQFAKVGYSTWRLFQLVFIVSMLPGLLGRERANEPKWANEARAIDVLWFPTGGGKTEAFFGLILTALFFDRLRGKLRGPTAWLRYPLRMLSVQQLQRLVNFIAEAEVVRVAESVPGDPFLVGYFAGQKNSPNDLTRKNGPSPFDRYVTELATPAGQRKYRLLQSCCYCGVAEPIVEASPAAITLSHRCASCGRLAPMVFSDAEVYRKSPSVLVGTVDRLARIGQTERFRQALGLVAYSCPDHGYSINRECVEGRCRRKSRDFVRLAAMPDPLPTIMLQDELHLLKESLGTYDSHFETLIDVIASHTGSPMPPKRIAATATIEGYEQHVAQLYGPRPAKRFPVKGRRLWESAYSTLAPENERARLYVGVLPMGRSAREVAQQFVKTTLAHAAATWQTNVRDGNNSSYDLVLAYANEKRTAADLGSNLSADTELVVLTGDKSMDDVRSAIDRVQTDINLPFVDRLKCIVATSIISHGVDLARLNLMTFIGFPGRAADYIQASSRVGREHLGVVFTVYRQGVTLERSAYTHFGEYHERLYQLVEPIPVARFSRGAFNRTLSAMFSAVLLNLIPVIAGHSLNGRSLQRGADAVGAYQDGAVTDAEIAGILRQAYGLGLFELPADVVATYSEMIDAAARSFRNQLFQRDDWSLPSRLRPEVVASLREVDEQVDVGVEAGSVALLGKLQR
jgi:hypothetical protein